MSPGQIVADARRRHRISQERLALRLGTKQPAISRLENDEVSPSVETLGQILLAMGEQLELTSRPVRRTYDALHRRANTRRSPEERLRLAISWNRLAGRLAEAGRTARRDG